MRSRKAVLSRIASILGTLAALVVALAIAFILGLIVFNVLSPDASRQILEQLPPDDPFSELVKKASTLLFMIFGILYLMWATVPLSLGGGSQFTPGRMLLYPVSLRKLFALDYLSELTSLGTIFAVPTIIAVALGAGAALGQIMLALVAALFAIACGISIAKWLSTSMSSLMQKRRTRGETVLALIGVVVALGGAFLGELTGYMMRHSDSLGNLRWTPPGAAAIALTEGLRRGGEGSYLLALAVLAAYTLVLIFVTYLIASRAALGAGGAKRSAVRTDAPEGAAGVQAGWLLPFLSAPISAVIEKELRYAMRNAQLRMMALMPLALIAVRVVRGNSPGGGNAASSQAAWDATSFTSYTDGLLVAGGVLYVFLILSSLACNLFAYEAGGMRSFILSPVDRRTILLGKNLTITFLALVFCALLLGVNQLVFRDLSLAALGFAALSFCFFAACFAVIGNWLSVRFPKRLQFGKRMNASGVTGFLLIPIMIGLAAPVFLATFAGYLAQSFTVKYATLALFAGLAVLLYCLLITGQGRALGRSEQEILEAVSGRGEEI